MKKHYLVRYDLVQAESDKLKIQKIIFFWEAVPPEVDALYAIDNPG